jgi:GT2 family glycosyltransferase
VSAPAVTVAILTYNGVELLDTVLASLARQSYGDSRTVVIDNGSTDGTGAWLAERWPDVVLVSLPENVGVTAGLNRCLAAAAGSEFVLLLNNDVELEPDCLEELLGALVTDAQAGVAQAKLLDFSRRELLDGTGDSYSWAGVAHRRGQGEFDEGQYDELQDVFGACGAAAMYRRSALVEVGGFDERFFAICEDVDWSFRARLAGYSCRYVPTAVVYHIGSASLGPRVSEFTLYHNWRNQIWVIAKNYPAASLLRHLPDLLMGVAASVYVAVRHRCPGVLLRAWRDALRGLPRVLEQRRPIQAGRRASTRQLEDVIDGGARKLIWWLAGSGRSTAPAARRQSPPGERSGGVETRAGRAPKSR